MNPLDPNSSFNGPLTPVQYRQNRNDSKEQETNTTTAGRSTRYIPLVLGAIALLVLPITVWQINNQQDVRQRASEQTPVQKTALVRVGEDFITDADIDLEYTKQQNATAYTTAPTALRDKILNDIIEKRLIAIEAEKRGVTVKSSEIDEKIKESRNQSKAPLNEQLVSEMLLAEKIASLVAPVIKGNVVYTNIVNTQTESLFETIQSNVNIRNTLVQAATPYLRQNGIQLLNDKNIAERNTLMSSESSLKLFELDEGAISGVINNGNRLLIVQIISKTEGEYESFDAFIDAQKDKYVELLIDN